MVKKDNLIWESPFLLDITLPSGKEIMTTQDVRIIYYLRHLIKERVIFIQQARVIQLKLLGLKSKDVGKIIGIEQKTVEMHISIAIESLRNYFNIDSKEKTQLALLQILVIMNKSTTVERQPPSEL